MSNQKRVRKSRQIRSTHFVDEVVMCALNDPLPPYHPQTPPPPDLQVCFSKLNSNNSLHNVICV